MSVVHKWRNPLNLSFFVFIANVSVSITFGRLYFSFDVISASTITIVSVFVNVVGSIISVSVIVSVTEISLSICKALLLFVFKVLY